MHAGQKRLLPGVASSSALVASRGCIVSWEFGLRVQEAWCFRPYQAVRNGLVHILYGTKGGRRRVLGTPLTEEQKALIELAKTFVVTEAESMVPRGCSLRQWKTIFYRVVRKIGLTKKQSGVTPHSLRHSYAHRLYSGVTHNPTPVQGGELAQDDPPADHAAREIVSGELGHSRPSIASAYIGGTRRRSEGEDDKPDESNRDQINRDENKPDEN